MIMVNKCLGNWGKILIYILYYDVEFGISRKFALD